MKLRSNSISQIKWLYKSGSAGFILIETMISFALLAAFAILLITTVSSSLSSQAAREQTYWLAELSRSKAEEIRVTQTRLPADGAVEGGWSWSASEERVWPDGRSRFDNDIALFDLRIRVWQTAHPEEALTTRTIVARRP